MAASPAIAVLAPRTRMLLEAPIASTLLRLAGPNIVVMLVQPGVAAAEAYFVGWLGTDALAGVSLVFPLIMLMQTMSAGGMGGGVSSAIARALGSGRRADAGALVVHAIVIAAVMGALFTVVMVAFGPLVYRAMGGTGAALAAAVAYSRVVFGGAAIVWLFNTLANVVRGTGNMALPALTVVGGAAIVLALSPSLILGWGPLPRLGVAGAATAIVVYYALGTLVLLAYLASGRGLVRLSLRRVRLQGRLFGEILRVGAPGALNTIQTNLTVILLTGLVGGFGTAALAGYGLGVRLEYLQIPLVFGFGSALVTMVGTNVGAGLHARAERVAWVGAAMAAAVTGAIGMAAALAPRAWLGLFSTEADVLAAGTTYLTVVGPTYGFFGVGLALYFASQGAGRLGWPLLAGFARLVVASAGGWLVAYPLGGGLRGLTASIAVAFIVFGVALVVAVRAGAWRRGRP
jgi:putative MATE family efflux protein